MVLSREPRSVRVRVGSALLAAVVGLGAALTVDAPAFADDLPSWADVEAARDDPASAEALASRIDSALTAAETRAADASAAALVADATAAAARTAADAASARAAELVAHHEAAEAGRALTHRQLGSIAGPLYRTHAEGPLVARLLTAADPDDLLERLGLLEKLSDRLTSVARNAHADALTAEALRAAAAEAQTAYAEAAEEAGRTAAEARAAAAVESTAVSDVQARTEALYAQLAALRDTTAEIERSQRLAARVEAQPDQPRPSGSGSSSSAPPDGPEAPAAPAPAIPAPPVTPQPPAPVDPPTPVAPPEPVAVADPEGAKAYARVAIGAYGWDATQFTCLERLWNRESGWRANALNPSSGAYGIPQAYPANKMAAAGADWRTNGNTQIDWGLSYIASRYGSPCAAWDHSQRVGWY